MPALPAWVDISYTFHVFRDAPIASSAGTAPVGHSERATIESIAAEGDVESGLASAAVEGAAAVVVKHLDDQGIAYAEADRLRAAAHPGVVELASVRAGGHGAEIRTRWAGRPLDAIAAPTPRQAGRIVASLASTLADLHHAGIVHGRVDAGHVLVDSAHRPRLCGFGPDDGGRSRAHDVAALGDLLTWLLALAAGAAGRSGRRRADATSRQLAIVAARAAAEPPHDRPTARRLAADLARIVEPELVTPTAAASRSSGRGRDPWRHVPPSAGLTMVALAVAGGAALVGARLPGRSSDSAAACDRSGPTGDVVVVDLDGDGCGEPVQVAGSVVRVGSRSWRVGTSEDDVVVGDWDCDGLATPAVLRPGTGEVFVFGSWPDRRTTVTSGRTVPGARSIRAERRDPCDLLVVTGERGAEAVSG